MPMKSGSGARAISAMRQSRAKRKKVAPTTWTTFVMTSSEACTTRSSTAPTSLLMRDMMSPARSLAK